MTWDPKLTGVLEFGDEEYSWNVYFPTIPKLQKFNRYKPIKLSQIRYKCRADVGDLAAMQLVCTRSVQSPMYEMSGARTWTKKQMEEAIDRGTHKTALDPLAIEQLAQELEAKIKKKQCKVVLWEDIKHNPPK